MNGFLIVDKPLGRTSSDVVLFVRKRLPRGTAVGHGGTLDPEASGVLPVCVGAATRLFDYIVDKQKTYVAEVQLGVETDTQDATGQVVRRETVQCGEDALKSVLNAFVGEIMQVPPMYSAIKKDGKRLYALARKGETVEIAPRPCRVDEIVSLGQTGENRYAIRVRCGRGVYIRTLCHDIGQALGCGGHMASLRRISAGIFSMEDALTLEEIDHLAQTGALEAALLPMDAPLASMRRVTVSGDRCAHAVKNGNLLKSAWLDRPVGIQDDPVRIYLEDRFAGVGQPMPDGSVKFRAMLLRTE